MRIVWAIMLLLLLGAGGYAYYKDPADCQKLGLDIASDTVAIVGAIKPPYLTPTPTSAPMPTPAQTSTPAQMPTPDSRPNATNAAPSASTSNGVVYPMGYVAKDPAAAQQPSSPAPTPIAAVVTPMRAAFGSFTDYDQALDAARKANVPMLVLFTGSDWCPYCQKLEQEVLSTSDFTKYVASHYVFVTIDDLRNTTLPESLEAQIKQLEQKFGISGFPTLMVVTDDEKEKGRMEGYNPGSGPSAVIAQLDQIAAK